MSNKLAVRPGTTPAPQPGKNPPSTSKLSPAVVKPRAGKAISPPPQEAARSLARQASEPHIQKRAIQLESSSQRSAKVRNQVPKPAQTPASNQQPQARQAPGPSALTAARKPPKPLPKPDKARIAKGSSSSAATQADKASKNGTPAPAKQFHVKKEEQAAARRALTNFHALLDQLRTVGDDQRIGRLDVAGPDTREIKIDLHKPAKGGARVPAELEELLDLAWTHADARQQKAILALPKMEGRDLAGEQGLTVGEFRSVLLALTPIFERMSNFKSGRN